MKMLLLLSAAGFIAFLVLGALASPPSSQSTASTATMSARRAAATVSAVPAPTATPAAIIVTAQTLIGQYDANKLAAQHRYSGRTVQTTGRIMNIDSSFGHPYLTLEPLGEGPFTLTALTCTFARSDEGPLLNLAKGQQVTVRGTTGDMFMTVIPLERCTLVGR